MLEDKLEEWYKNRGKKLVIFLVVLFLAYLTVRLKILGLFAPFIVAWLFATMLNKFVSWANKKLSIPRGIGTIISMLTILSGVLCIIWAIIRKLWEQVVGIATNLPSLTNQLVEQVRLLEEKYLNIFDKAPSISLLGELDQLIEEVMSSLSSYLGSAIPIVYNAISKVPDVVLFIVVMLVATFFMTKDYYKIKEFVKAQFSDTIVNKVVIMQRGVLHAIGGYVKTQLILMSMTFSICVIGLFIFNVGYALLISVIIALVDALPVFGSGTILIPWAIYNLFIGDYSLAVGLLCIYGIIFVGRQIFEPKILSTQIGVYALVTVMAVYIGYKTMGVLGLIIGPAVAVILSMLQNVGALPQFKPIKNKNDRGDTSEKHTD